MTDIVYLEAAHNQIIHAVACQFPMQHRAAIFHFLRDRMPAEATLIWLGEFLLARADNLALHGSTIDQARASFDGVALEGDDAVLQIIADRAESMDGYGDGEGKVHQLLGHLSGIVATEAAKVRHPLDGGG